MPDVVSQKTLEEVVWKGRIVIDSTSYPPVGRLRNILDDHDEDKPIIQTVHGEGYRLIPAVTSMAQEQQLIIPSAQAQPLWVSFLPAILGSNNVSDTSTE